MKNLKELEQKYAELGKEIEALKQEPKYPIYCKDKYGQVVRFIGLTSGKISKQSYDKIEYPDEVGLFSTNYIPHTDTTTWQKLDVCPETGFFDGQLVWCWDNDDTHARHLNFYDAKNNLCFDYEGDRFGNLYENYEAYEGNYPQWALEAFNTL